MSKEEDMKNVISSVKNCKKCSLWKTRKNPVPGEGLIDTDILLVGEAPGYNEDLQGRPFVGKAGEVLNELLDSVGLKRGEVYIANILKCRPTLLSFMKYNICISCKKFEECYQNILKH
jgi:DNA polymerase